MPRTRNITCAQWEAANVSNSTITRNRIQNHDYESEKENEGRTATRATRSQTRTRSNNRVVLGSTTTAGLRISTTSKGPERTANTTKVKGKGKGKAPPPPKRTKLPLQDITSQFLPAPEAANRGEENEAAEHVLQQTENSVNLVSPLPFAQGPGSSVLGPTISTPTYLNSPLPPSSPPSAITSSPQYPKILPKSNTSWLGLSSYKEENNLWNEFDDGHLASLGSPGMISSNSDPFGFVALERKLKIERRAAAPSPLKRHHHQDESDEDLGRVLVANTSSPRPVRRSKRPLYQGDSPFPPAIFGDPHTHYVTPPTPHKDKKKQRLSHEADGVLSPSSSSMPSTPSPSKPSAQKLAREAGKKLKNNLNGNEDVFVKTRNRTGRGIVKGEPSATSKVTMTPLELGRSLDDDVESEGEPVDPKSAKATKSNKITKKACSTGTKNPKKEKIVEQNDNDEDYAKVCSLLVHAIPSSLFSIRNGSENDKSALHISSY